MIFFLKKSFSQSLLFVLQKRACTHTVYCTFLQLGVSWGVSRERDILYYVGELAGTLRGYVLVLHKSRSLLYYYTYIESFMMHHATLTHLAGRARVSVSHLAREKSTSRANANGKCTMLNLGGGGLTALPNSSTSTVCQASPCRVSHFCLQNCVLLLTYFGGVY